MNSYAMVMNDSVIGVLHNQKEPPFWPPTNKGIPIIPILCDESVKTGMKYNPDTGGFFDPLLSNGELDPVAERLDKIESTLELLTADTVTAESIDTAISEGVNEV